MSGQVKKSVTWSEDLVSVKIIITPSVKLKLDDYPRRARQSNKKTQNTTGQNFPYMPKWVAF